MRIIQVVHAFPPEIGGIEAHVFNLSREIVKKGHKVLVVTTKTKNSPPREIIDGVEVVRYSSIHIQQFSSVRLIPFLPLRLALIDADIYHSHGYGSTQPFFTSIAALIKRKPFVFTLHGYPKLQGISGLFKWFYKNFPARIFLAISAKVITVTEATIPDIEKEVSRSKITTIHNGVDFLQYKPKSPLSSLKTNNIVFIGRFDSYKGIDTLIQAFAIVKKEIPDAKLQLIGHDEGVVSSIQSLASKLCVKFEHTEVKPEKMPEIYEQASLVVLPSKYEGLSLVLLEAIASGRPVLSTPVGAAPILFSEVYKTRAKNMLFEIGNTKELAKKIIRILKNKKKYDRLCFSALESLRKTYSWETAAEKTIEVYKTLL